METSTTRTTRQTKYAHAVMAALKRRQHATNLELLQDVQEDYPEVSATTIHRVSARLKERGVISCAPKSANGSERYDITPTPHHHFTCTACSGIRDVPDTPEAQAVVEQLKKLSGDCAIAGVLTMSGICKRCAKEGKQ